MTDSTQRERDIKTLAGMIVALNDAYLDRMITREGWIIGHSGITANLDKLGLTHQDIEDYLTGGHQPTYADSEPEPEDTDLCPDHGVQRMTSGYSSAGADPYYITVLACGCHVACFGPGEPNVVVKTRALRKGEALKAVAQ